ncbi:MAG: tRNA lysidine(34) synthetase TilS [Synechococcus sp.]|nr:tRNA lysidine(34) synthetase TilS [Synechococcus sp.]
MAARWSADHLKLHQQLLRQSSLLPHGEPLLLAVSGGQDSMAMAALLQDLRRLHHWPLQLWHGDHQLRAESGQQAMDLQAWAQREDLPLLLDRWQHPKPDEAAARRWRYHCLSRRAAELGIGHVLTAHTASDKAETVILHAARGSHRRGLASLRQQRPLAPGISLVRPMLSFSRSDTSRICAALKLPIWLDPSNQATHYSRNRVRHEVLPVLEQLHPGASQRLAALSQQLGEEEQHQQELTQLAVLQLMAPNSKEAPPGLQRPALMALHSANQALLLQSWLQQQGAPVLASGPLKQLLQRLQPGQPPGRWALAANLELSWNREWIRLQPSP